jgi:predicted transcriptional regulator
MCFPGVHTRALLLPYVAQETQDNQQQLTWQAGCAAAAVVLLQQEPAGT